METTHPLFDESNFSGHYFIPNDNPYIGQIGALEEYYAIGLRNPFKMSLDQPSQRIFVGDVGSNMSFPLEEVYEVRAGDNHGWCIKEGNSTTEVNGLYKIKKSIAGDFTKPNFYYDHTHGNSVAGGFIYRGSQLPHLFGKYIFGDWTSRNIWSLDFKNGNIVEKIAIFNSSELRTFGLNHKKEILLAGFSGKIHKLAPIKNKVKIFQNLSKSAIFKLNRKGKFSGIEIQPIKKLEGILLPYKINAPLSEDGLWEEGVEKNINVKRWMFIPEGKKIGFSPEDEWVFPKGSVFIKHIEVPIYNKNKSFLKNKRIETQFLVHGQDNIYYGIGYKWDDEGKDAILIKKSNKFSEFEFFNKNGMKLKRKWLHNDPNRCMTCHNRASGYTLGMRTFQFNQGQQLSKFSNLFDNKFAQNRDFAKGASLEDKKANSEKKVRSWLDVNCAYCHRGKDGASGRALFDLRFKTNLYKTGLFNNKILIPFGPPGSKLLIAKNPEKSLLFFRAKSKIPGLMMPPTAQHEPNPQAMANMKNWIEKMPEEIICKNPKFKIKVTEQQKIPFNNLFNTNGILDKNSLKIVKAAKYGEVKIDSENEMLIYKRKSKKLSYDSFRYFGKTINGKQSENGKVVIKIWGRNKKIAIYSFLGFIFLCFFIFLIFIFRKILKLR